MCKPEQGYYQTTEPTPQETTYKPEKDGPPAVVGLEPEDV